MIRNRRGVLYAGAAFTVIIGMFALRNDFTNNWVQWFDAKTPFRQDLEFVEANLSGINAIEFSLPAGEPGGVAKPEYLQALDNFAVWVRQQPDVSHASTLADILKQQEQAKAEGAARSKSIGESAASGAATGVVGEGASSGLTPGADPEDEDDETPSPQVQEALWILADLVTLSR